jgi:predicted esterase
VRHRLILSTNRSAAAAAVHPLLPAGRLVESEPGRGWVGQAFGTSLFAVWALVAGTVFAQAEPNGDGANKSGKANSGKMSTKSSKPMTSLSPIVEQPGLPRVLLIGDSISIGYTVMVRERLGGRANLHRIPENGAHSRNGLEKMRAWLGDRTWDVIHFNFGLHDIKRDANGCQIPIDEYERNLVGIVAILKATGAKLIWASTTPVPAVSKPLRREEDVIAYNAVAKKVMVSAGVTINDLHALVLPRGDDWRLKDNVHFKPEGSLELAGAVTKAILPMLPAAASPQPPANKAVPVNDRNKPAATGFLDRVYHDADGSHKYVVFIPHEKPKDGKFPALLFLHGAGERGVDGQLPAKVGLGKAIRAREKTFPFIAVFPQCRAKGPAVVGWKADGADAQRALRMLSEVEATWPVDPDRIILTGLSMGGFGTFSIAAKHPDRWAAIVPICGGGDVATAKSFAHLPCWCFHGANDRVVKADLSRRMVAALKEAGGEPKYTEFAGVDHNSWDPTYATEELWPWLLERKRTAKR